MTDKLFIYNQRKMIFKKSLILTLLLYVFCFGSSAQTAKPATLFKIDSAPIKVYGLKIQGDKITYRLSSSKKAKIYSIAQSQCIKVRYANGKETIFKKPEIAPKQAVSIEKDTLKSIVIPQKPSPKPQRPDLIYIKKSGIIDCKIIEISDKKIKYIVVSDDSQKIRVIKRKNVEKFERNMMVDEKSRPVSKVNNSQSTKKQEVAQKKTEEVTTHPKALQEDYAYNTYTIGIEASQMLTIGNSPWADEQKGLGLKRAIGGSLRFTKRFNRAIGLATEIGFRQWSSEYRFSRETDLLYTYSVGLSQASVSVGPKFYFREGFYTLAKVHIEGLRLRQTGRIGEYLTAPDMVQSTIYWGGSGAFGYEHQIGNKFIVDASIGYNYLANPFPILDYAYPPNKPLHQISFRIGFGLITNH